jgi:Lysyl oxidase
MFKFLLLLDSEMGVNLVPQLDGFSIYTENFIRKEEGGDGSVDLGCIDKGSHRVLRFNLHCLNVGDEDLVIGNPKERPDIFEHSDVFDTGFQFREKFFVYALKNDDSGVIQRGYKIPFCFDGGPKYSCDYQGIAAGGNEDVYESDLPCQFVRIDDVPDGEYILEATVNAPSVDAAKNGKGKVLFEEDNYDDNTVAIRLLIQGDDIKQIGR